MGEERIADTQVTRHRAAEQTGEKDRPHNRGSRAEVECDAHERHDSQPARERDAVGITQLLHRFLYGGNWNELDDGVEEQEEGRQRTQRTPRPQRGRRTQRNGNVGLHETLLLTMGFITTTNDTAPNRQPERGAYA